MPSPALLLCSFCLINDALIISETTHKKIENSTKKDQNIDNERKISCFEPKKFFELLERRNEREERKKFDVFNVLLRFYAVVIDVEEFLFQSHGGRVTVTRD